MPAALYSEVLFTIRQLLAPVEKTANLCKMIFLPPFVIHGTHSITRENILMHKNKYEKLLGLFRDEQVDISRVKSLEYLNDYE